MDRQSENLCLGVQKQMYNEGNIYLLMQLTLTLFKNSKNKNVIKRMKLEEKQ